MDNPPESQQNNRLRRPRKPGDLPSLQRKLWWAVLRAEEVLDDTYANQELRLKAVHALVQACQAYHKLLETSELTARIEAIERRLLEEERRRYG